MRFRPRARRAEQRNHQQAGDAGFLPGVGDHNAELAVLAAGVGDVARLARQALDELALQQIIIGANRPDRHRAAVAQPAPDDQMGRVLSHADASSARSSRRSAARNAIAPEMRQAGTMRLMRLTAKL